MFLRGILGGLQSALGSFGREIISGLQAVGGTIRDALHLGRVAGVEVSPAAVVKEWGDVLIAEARKGTFITLHPDESISRSFYEDAQPWQSKRYSYKYMVHGLDRATGEVSTRYYNFASKREMLPGQILEQGRVNAGPREGTLGMEIWDIRLTGATHIPGETW